MKNQDYNTQTKGSNEYILLLRGEEWYKRLSSEEIQDIMDKAKAWFGRLADQGKIREGRPLGREGAMVSQSRTLSDGPFVESKEAIGGFLLIHADSLQEAIDIARSNPSLAYGNSIEVRPVAEECPLDALAREQTSKSELVGSLAS